MGNCMETCSESWRREGTAAANQVRFEEDGDDRKVPKGGGFDELEGCGEDDDGNKGVMRVKIVLTRQELEWLMLQLNGGGGSSSNRRGGVDSKKRDLVEVLGEIERGRSSSRAVAAAAAAWRPSLESIMEMPEVPDRMDRS